MGESNGKLPVRTCPGCSIPEPYQSPDWALVPVKPVQGLNTTTTNNNNNIYVIRTNKIYTFSINDIIQLYCLRHISNNQVSRHRPDCLHGCMKEYHKTACTSLPEDEHLVDRNMSKTI